MPKMSITGIDELQSKLSKISGPQSRRILEAAVKDGADIVADKVRANLNSVLSGTSSGALAGSLGISPVDTDSKGMVNAKVGFDGYDSSGTPNPLKAAVLEYGSRRQQARPFMTPAKNATQGAVKKKMAETIEREIEKIMN